MKVWCYDSFGNVLEDSCPDFHFPLGFAGGLADADTGLVRFGFRDYDLQVGRFTCPDPTRDTGGDHDLYDYCVDDPINGCDPSGLISTSASTYVYVLVLVIIPPATGPAKNIILLLLVLIVITA
ncbi:RHS repeat-associated core domain-containing protein [Desulfovibrio sp. OttesenSCG-928-F07]|nr:RHS repeat-associated core domain-containing protein [Desulfovibrio sp. OttesenSCG-928-F07]